MANWKIELQVVKSPMGEDLVPIKNVRFYPMQDANGDLKGFGRLKNPILQMLVNHEGSTSPPLRLQWIYEAGTEGKFRIKWPDKEVHPVFKTGSGKSKAKPWDSRKQWEDTDQPKKKVNGEHLDFYDGKSFFDHLLNKMKVSETLVNEIICTFVQAMNELSQVKEAA